MSFYRNLIAAVATMGFATSVFAADETIVTTETTAAPVAAENDVKATTEQTAIETTTETAQTATPAGDTATATATVAQADTTIVQDKVDLNKATAKDLMKVKGISAGKAKAIVSFRTKHGDFKSVDDLKQVKGFKKMSERTWKKISDQLTIG